MQKTSQQTISFQMSISVYYIKKIKQLSETSYIWIYSAAVQQVL